jgi:hypothetical protein
MWAGSWRSVAAQWNRHFSKPRRLPQSSWADCSMSGRLTLAAPDGGKPNEQNTMLQTAAGEPHA